MFFVLPLRDTAPRPDIPYVTWSLIGLNVLVFLLVQLPSPGGPQSIIALFGLEPARLWAGEALPGGLPAWLSLFTSAFLHFDLMHLIGNMLMLWILGDALEWLCGSLRFAIFYLLCAVLSALVTALLGAGSEMAAAGASGAIAGVMGGYLVNFPRARITCWVFWWFFFSAYSGMRNFSALWFIGFWILQQLWQSAVALSLLEPGPFGVYAHTSGALAGIGLIYLLRLPDRVPKRGEHWGTSGLSAPLLGDEGDAGGGAEPRLPAHEQARYDRIIAMNLPFDGSAAQRMLDAGDLDNARAYCELMLEQAEKDENYARMRGYDYLLEEISRREKEIRSWL